MKSSKKKILKKLICEKPREITMKMPKNVVPKKSLKKLNFTHKNF